MTTQYARSLTADHTAPSVPQFVGRQSELTLIWNQCKAARGGYARVVLLAGELGIGKTRILDEVAARAAQDGATVLWGGHPIQRGCLPIYHFWKRWVSMFRE